MGYFLLSKKRVRIAATLLIIVLFVFYLTQDVQIKSTGKAIIKSKYLFNATNNVHSYKTPTMEQHASNNENPSDGNGSSSERTHLAFLKVHKASSTTVMNMLQRFGEKRKLIFVLPKQHNMNYLGGWRAPLNVELLLEPPRNRTYDMLFNHVAYTRQSFRRIMPPDTKYVAIVRQPFDMLVSAIEYYGDSIGYLKAIPIKNRVAEYLANPAKYEPRGISMTRNTMSHDFGLRKNADRADIDSVLADFDLIMVTEFFDESMVLLKRLMCWSMQDILYVKKNSHNRKLGGNYTEIQRDNHRQFAAADYYLYETALKNFKQHLSLQTRDFRLEVEQLRSVLSSLKRFCESKNQPTYTVRQSPWNLEFEVHRRECIFMFIGELQFLNFSRARQRKMNKLAETSYSNVTQRQNM